MNSLERLYIALHAGKQSQDDLSDAHEFKANEISFQTIANELKNIRNSKNIDMLLEAEKVFIKIDMTKDNSNERLHSLMNGLKRIYEAETSIIAVRNFDMYSGCIRTTQPKMFDKEGLPNDRFRHAINGQMTSLMNDARSENTKARQVVLRERMLNINEIKQIYKNLQREQVQKYNEQQQVPLPVVKKKDDAGRER